MNDRRSLASRGVVAVNAIAATGIAILVITNRWPATYIGAALMVCVLIGLMVIGKVIDRDANRRPPNDT